MILDGRSKKEVVDELNECCILPPRLYQLKDKEYKFKITDKMEKWDIKKLDKILQNTVYIGDLVQSKKRRISHKVHKIVENDSDKWIIVHNHHEPIIKKEDFEQVQDIIYNRDIRRTKNNDYDTFSGHLKCADCNNSFTVKKSKKYTYYYCSSFLKDKSCTNHAITKEKLEDAVLSIVNNQIKLIIDIDNNIEKIIKNKNINYDFEILNIRLKDIENNIIKYEQLKKELEDDYMDKYIKEEEYNEYKAEYNMYLEKYIKEKDNITDKLKKVSIKNDTEITGWIKKFKNKEGIKNLSKKTIDELIDNIIIHENGNIDIVFKYRDKYFEAIDFIKKHNCDIISNEFLLTSSENTA